MIELPTDTSVNTGRSASTAWLRALELTASIPRMRHRVMPTVIEDLADRFGDVPALLSDNECLTYRELATRQNQYARWALEQGLAKGDVVCLLMPNLPEYFAIWLGITSVGCVVALLNTNLVGPSLSHCINTVGSRILIVSGDLVNTLHTALSGLTAPPAIWTHSAGHASFRRIDLYAERLPGHQLSPQERRPLTIEDRALYIFTSGTTGLPKAASISHARIMQWSHWLAGIMDVQPTDRIYDCLPMYHSIGGVLVPGAALVGGGSVVIREKFSAHQFWNDVIRWDCTIFQYIGELCRYLLHATSSSDASGHRIRMVCGNGMAFEVWEEFRDRFRVPRVLEFYAATEGSVSLFNVEGKRGAIGRIPPYLEHRFSPALVLFDVDKCEAVRDERGFCIRCPSGTVGEALGKVLDDPAAVGSRFDGYSDEQASSQKILRNVFKPGDSWFRTGDLMRRDHNGFFYFVDRVGDTFRWKGENVSTSEVSEALSSFRSVKHAVVYGVVVPGAEGRAGMAALVAEDGLDLPALRKHLIARLPPYARPLLLRLRDEIELTATFKYTKVDLERQGYNPATTTDRIYLDSTELQEFVQLDKALYERIRHGQLRL